MNPFFRTEENLIKLISSYLDKEIKIIYPGSQGVGNTWQKTLGMEINNKKSADWNDKIEIKCLVGIKTGSDLTLSSKTPDWNRLSEFNITRSSFFHMVDYGYKQNGGALFFTKKLRYVVSPSSRSIDWYVVKLDDSMPTEPYSKAPSNSKIGKLVFSWKIEDILKKFEKLSVTLVYKKGEYPNGIIIPMRSYLIEMFPEKVLDLLADGSIRYEIRYFPLGKFRSLLNEVMNIGRQKFSSDDTVEFWNWVDSEFEKKGGKFKDYGTGFRLNRGVLNSLLDLKGEIMKQS